MTERRAVAGVDLDATLDCLTGEMEASDVLKAAVCYADLRARTIEVTVPVDD